MEESGSSLGALWKLPGTLWGLSGGWGGHGPRWAFEVHFPW